MIWKLILGFVLHVIMLSVLIVFGNDFPTWLIILQLFFVITFNLIFWTKWIKYNKEVFEIG